MGFLQLDSRAFALVGFLVIAVYVVTTLRQWTRLRHFKGPAFAGFSQLWLISCVGGGRTHLDLWEACKKYGDIARVGPNDLITSDPDLMRHMLNVRTRFQRSSWYDAMRLDPTKDNVLSQRNDDLHASTRSKMVGAYSGKEVDNIETTIDTNVERLIELLDTKYVANNQAFDFGYKAQYFTLDVISALAFGEQFGDLETDSDVNGYIKAMEESMPTIIVTTVMPWMMKLLQLPIFKPMLPSEKDKVGVGKVMAIAKRVAVERFGPNPNEHRDMIGSFIARGLLQHEVESEILMQILAGADTTATAIRATMLYILSTPRVVEKMRAEIEQARPSLPVITDNEARAMPYLQAVVKEGLRIHPPVVGLMSKEVPAGGDTFKGKYLPGGTKIGYCAWGIFRRRDIWGDDADEFRPERWLDCSEDQLRLMEGTLELVFGYGRWQCLGKNIAQMELNKVFVEPRRFSNSNNRLHEVMQPQTRHQFVSQLAKFVDTSGINGVHFDWEARQSSSSDVYLYLATLRELRRQLSHKYSISISLPAQYSLLKEYPVRELATVVDYFVYLTHDLYVIKAGVRPKQVVIGEAGYGRAFTMVEARCYGPDCLFKVKPPSARVSASACSNVSRVFSGSQIKYILRQRRDNSITWHDKKSASDFLMFDGEIILSLHMDYLKARTENWRKLGFLGTAGIQAKCKYEIPTSGRDTHTTPNSPETPYHVPENGLLQPSRSGADSPQPQPQPQPRVPKGFGGEESQRPYQDLPIRVSQVLYGNLPRPSSVIDKLYGSHTQYKHIGQPIQEITTVFTIYVTTVAGRTKTVTRCIIGPETYSSSLPSPVSSYPIYVPPVGHEENDNPSKAHQPTSGDTLWTGNHPVEMSTLITSETGDTDQTDSGFSSPFTTLYTSRFWNTSTTSTTQVDAEPPMYRGSDIKSTTDVLTPNLPSLIPHGTATSTNSQPTCPKETTTSPTTVASVTTSNPWTFTLPGWKASTSAQSELEPTLSIGPSESLGTETGSTQLDPSPGIHSESTGVSSRTSQIDSTIVSQPTSLLESGTRDETTINIESAGSSTGADSEVLSSTLTDEKPTSSMKEPSGPGHTVSGSPGEETDVTSEIGSSQAPATDNQSDATEFSTGGDGTSSLSTITTIVSEGVGATIGGLNSGGAGATNTASSTQTMGGKSEGPGQNESSVHSEDTANGSVTATGSQGSDIQTAPLPTGSGSVSADLPIDSTRPASGNSGVSTITSSVTLSPHETSTENEVSTAQSQSMTISRDIRTNEVTKISESKADSIHDRVDTWTNTPSSDQTSAFSGSTDPGTRLPTASSLLTTTEAPSNTDAISDMLTSTNLATESNGDREISTDIGLGLILPSLPSIDLTSLPATTH
ncbi:unnamed protein product [Fusarium langsethiae]|nr:unnamed protein product [Fusarium langsethiae]